MKSEPKFMIIYLCSNCGLDFGRHELEAPVCFNCGAAEDHTVISRQELTPEVIAERVKLTSNRMYENLQKAWDTRPDEIRNDPKKEKEFIELLKQAKELRDKTQEAIKDIGKAKENEN